MNFTFRSIDEATLGPKWQAQFELMWPEYRRWFLREGEASRPTYRASVRALRQHMPEFERSYVEMTEIAGGGDLAARFLSQYCPPAFFAACSQVVWLHGEPALVRNYDYSPLLCDGLIMRTRWGDATVIGMLDSMSGVLDGMNDHGLAISLAFGGRRISGVGFGIAIVLRYILETCTCVADAVSVLRRIPVHLAYNVAVLDRQGNHATVMIAPGESVIVADAVASTNHQGKKFWASYAKEIKSHARHQHLRGLTRKTMTNDGAIAEFKRPPLFSNAYDIGYGTVYTAAYIPSRGEVQYLWRDGSLCFDFDNFTETHHETVFLDSKGKPAVIPTRSAAGAYSLPQGPAVAIGQ